MDTTGDTHKSVNSPFYRNKKGQFTSKKRWLNNVKLRGSKRKRPRDVYMSTLKGRRIVELATLAEELWCTKCNIGLSLRDTVSETHNCFASTLEVNCRVCGTHYKINTCKSFNKESGKSTYPINGQIVVGMYDIGIGPHKLNDFLSCSDIPTVNPSLLKKYEDEIANIINQCTKENIEQAIDAEKLATIAANKIEEVI
ncbi:unnamed protein product [Euphydryas editha]|uniref:Mutator-like transposase domain-containing protein n=1 Tax=Euphydryas editha TaxID=104508 RepID=A0AAU9ULC7_EUPED|nr:unnamed protein product [Euphydryas editha]